MKPKGETMKLQYRGVSYEYDASKREIQNKRPSNLTYRGVPYRIDPNTKQSEVPVQPVAYRLVYRGSAYFVNKTAQEEVSVVTQPESTFNLYNSI
jgi:hypothetical protein